MEHREILRAVDHTLLAVTAGEADIRMLCRDAARFGTASVCVPPLYVGTAVKCLPEHAVHTPAVCTVIGFPNGYLTDRVMAFEAADAVANGADEIDMVLHIGALKSGAGDAVLAGIRAVREVCPGRILKVIIETCKLTREEKIRACKIVSESGADFIKTSTGFAGGGATPEDVRLLREYTASHVRVKAAGGISSFEDAAEMLAMGADRLGTSRLVALAKAEEKGEEYDTDTAY